MDVPPNDLVVFEARDDELAGRGEDRLLNADIVSAVEGPLDGEALEVPQQRLVGCL